MTGGPSRLPRVDVEQIDVVTASPRSAGSRTARGVVVIIAILVLLGVLGWRMVPHPVGAARTFGKYNGKAVTTARGALSDVETVLLGARTAARDDSFGPYTATIVGEAEEALSGRQSTFDSIQPPDARADSLQQELDQILTDATDHVREVRVAVRRGELGHLLDVAQPLNDDAGKLNSFVERHG